MSILLIVVLLLLLFGGGWYGYGQGWYGGPNYVGSPGYGWGSGLIGLLFILIVLWLIFGHLGGRPF